MVTLDHNRKELLTEHPESPIFLTGEKIGIGIEFILCDFGKMRKFAQL